MQIQVVSRDQRLNGGGGYYGVEVPAGFACLQDLGGNVDPQHGGGVFHYNDGSIASSALSAAGVADSVVWLAEWPVTFVTARLDPDALVAAMLLDGMLPRGTDAVARLSRLDTGTLHPEYRAELVVRTVGDDPQWGPVAALCMQWPKVSTDTLVAAVQHVVIGSPAPAEYLAARAAYDAAWQKIQSDILPRMTRLGQFVARGADLPFVAGSGAMAAAYSIAPVAALSTMINGKRKHTIAVCNGWTHGHAVIQEFKRLIVPLEARWGGSDSIVGSPFAGTNVSDEAFVALVMCAVLAAAGEV